MLHFNEKIDLTDYTLLIPSVAVGNVGQLTVDLVISTLKLRRIGRILDWSFIPIVGADPYDQNSQDICTTNDIYVGEEHKIVAFQIRSILTKKPIEFFQLLSNFVKEHKIKKVVILTSSYDYEKRDKEIRSAPQRYLASNTLLSEYKDLFQTKGWLAFEKKQEDTKLRIPGGGFATDLYEILEKDGVPCIVLIEFCSEGDNTDDAVRLFMYFADLFKLVPRDVVTKPTSWKFLYGDSPPVEIY